MTKKRLSSIFIKIKKPLLILVIGISFFLCYLTLHDMQTAQGVGLYLSMQFQQDNVFLFNILVDCLGGLLLLTALLLPCLTIRRLRFDSFFRFFSVYLAFIPTIRPASLVHLGDTFANLTTRQIFSAENPLTAMLGGIADIVLLLRSVLPLLLIMLWINQAYSPSKLQKWQIGIIVGEVIFILLHFLFPDLSAETAYFLNYLLLVWCFREWEKICDHFPKFADWGMILFGGCWLRGVYRMLELMSISNL